MIICQLIDSLLGLMIVLGISKKSLITFVVYQ